MKQTTSSTLPSALPPVSGAAGLIPGKNPDGSANKFKRAVKDFARSGRIGISQQRNTRVVYRNLLIEPAS